MKTGKRYMHAAKSCRLSMSSEGRGIVIREVNKSFQFVTTKRESETT